MRSGIDYPGIFSSNRIEFRTRGANVGSGEINIKCPWCGPADPSYHLGINPSTYAYKCWRNPAHRGRTPLRLFAKLLGFERARSTLRQYGIVPGHANKADIERIPDTDRPFELVWPEGVVEYDATLDRRFFEYLLTRGFADADIPEVIARYGLRVGRYGPYSGRLVIPTYRGGRPVYFTARAITPATLRYKACKDEESVVDPHELLFNEDLIESHGGVILVEGALDAIKATTYAPLPAVALSTNHASKAQLATLKRARRIFLMIDNDHLEHDSVGAVTTTALALYYELIKQRVPVILQPIPKGYKDLAAIPYSKYPQLINTQRLLEIQR